MAQGGWDSGRGAGPAPSGKRRFWLRFGPFGATSVVPPTEAPGRRIRPLQEASPEPPSLPPAAQRPPPRPPRASSQAAQGFLPGRPGSPLRPGSPPGSIHFRTSRFARAYRPLAQSQEYAIHLPWPLQIHHVLRNLTPGLDCSHRQATHNRKAWCWTCSQAAGRAAEHLWSSARDLLLSPTGRINQ